MIYTDYLHLFTYTCSYLCIYISGNIPFPGTMTFLCWCLGSQPLTFTYQPPYLLPLGKTQVPLMHQRFAAEMQGVVLKAETAVMSALSAQMESDQVTDEDQKNLGV